MSDDEEVIAVVAAVERFMRETLSPAVPITVEPTGSPWKRAALLEGVSRQPE